MIEVVDNQHRRIRITCRLGEYPFECREEGRVVESPFRRFLTGFAQFSIMHA